MASPTLPAKAVAAKRTALDFKVLSGPEEIPFDSRQFWILECGIASWVGAVEREA
ncbi:hypothetical protein E4U17_008074 [Claviceps sp. LM77 group G4]|nr:hypothetical protein E4U17_008074 [Claviceps sp. LM77 group G4]KAG6081260.1 hypothetical protein E4U33_006922 [Claviceps sp. LM78 group G4]